MRWGLVGGGLGSQIGEAHRIGSRLDGLFTLAAAALDADPARGQAFGRQLGIAEGRSYGDWREMLVAEEQRPAGERLDLVTVATPNATHYEIARGFLEAGFNVLCEKPLTMTVEEAEALVGLVDTVGAVCAVNFGYSGYPMAIQAREMIRHGDLGDVRVVVAEFAHGAHTAGDDAENMRVRWRYDPAAAGVSSAVADLGIHALHMAQFMTGQRITSLSAHFDHCVPGRRLEDDALLAYRFDKGAVGRLWTSAIACGQPQGFSMRVFGSKGGLRWHQEFPNQIHFTPLGQSTRVLERGDGTLYPAAVAASRIAVGHAEGMLEAFGNIYRGLHDAIGEQASRVGEGSAFPTVRDGIDMVRAVHASAASAALDGAWIDLATLSPSRRSVAGTA